VINHRNFVAGVLLLLAATANAQDRIRNWTDIGEKDIVTKDSITKKGYTLLFITKVPAFDAGVKARMIDAFFAVYPKQAKLYNKSTARKVIFLIDPAYKGVAATAGYIIRYNPEWFVKNPEDIDVVTHEVMHITQSYGRTAGAGWLTKGIVDYVRYQMG
jgi:hypothetical protein